MSNADIIEHINKLTDLIFPEAIKWRRQIHAHPEIGFKELKTSELIFNVLEQQGLQPKIIAKTGVVAVIEGKIAGPTIALRADIDALPIIEEADIECKSQLHGVMHACGHDAHAAILLGVAKVLGELRHLLAGKIKLIFQPSEEVPPGGALPMIDEGVLKDPDVDAIFALHVNPHYPAGVIGIKEGVMMAAADVFELKIIGAGGHGAAPHQTIDPIIIAAQLINALQTIGSRLVNPTEPVVVTIGRISGGTTHNVIPNTVDLKGTCRSLNNETRRKLHHSLERLTKAIVDGYGASYQLNYHYGYPPVINHKHMAEIVRRAGRN
ncbi:MAG: amidohydrolase, partial [Bacillota bacterium]|nr:amidohydrolase [Bacillota bacterium]